MNISGIKENMIYMHKFGNFSIGKFMKRIIEKNWEIHPDRDAIKFMKKRCRSLKVFKFADGKLHLYGSD